MCELHKPFCQLSHPDCESPRSRTRGRKKKITTKALIWCVFVCLCVCVRGDSVGGFLFFFSSSSGVIHKRKCINTKRMLLFSAFLPCHGSLREKRFCTCQLGLEFVFTFECGLFQVIILEVLVMEGAVQGGLCSCVVWYEFWSFHQSSTWDLALVRFSFSLLMPPKRQLRDTRQLNEP